MLSFKKTKFIPQRPGSSASSYTQHGCLDDQNLLSVEFDQVYDTENSDYDTERKSRIPRLPKRTYSLERKKSHLSSRQSSRNESSAVSMIPRLEWKKANKKDTKPSTAPTREKKPRRIEPLRSVNKESSTPESSDKALMPLKEPNLPQKPLSEITDSCLESRINENFTNFKNNVLRIPEYWTDAGHTVTNILKNAVNVVEKQYPTADVEAFELEIQKILKATETVKHQILAKTEKIINQANKIYVDRSEKEGEPSEEELERLTQKMEELMNEVHARKNVFEDLLKCGNETKHLMELDKELKEKVGFKDTLRCIRNELEMEWEKKNEEERGTKRMEIKKSKMVIDSSPKDSKRKENVAQSCGDVLRQETEDAEGADPIPDARFQKNSRSLQEEKFTQTINLWTAELHRRDEALTILNNQILELHQLCKDHISKFKSFNLQIKLRGICNKAQHTSISKEIQILNDEKVQLTENNNKLQYYSKDLETAIKKKNLDLYQKDKVINQQKRLLHVRDELIEMLKSKCKIEVDKV